MNKVEFVKNYFKEYYIDRGPENGILQGTKYAGCATHCRACLNTLVRMIKPMSALEIGSWHYESSIAMSAGMDTYLPETEGVIYSFDIKKGGYDGAGTTQGLPSRIKPMFWYPHKTHYDPWKEADPGVVYPEFMNMTNDQISDKNLEILNSIKPADGFDLIFIDGDHSYEGVKRDWEIALKVSHPETLIVFDNVWDIRLKEVRDFYDSLNTSKWDFEEFNDEHKDFNMVQDSAVLMPII